MIDYLLKYNMMKIVLLTGTLLCSLSLMAQDRSVRFESTSYEEALIKAKKENKLLFVDCYTTWCGPCKMLARDVFTNNEVADYFNEHFISLQVDCEKGEGPALRKCFGIGGFPTLLFVNGDGEVVNKIVGASRQPVFLENVKSGLDPKTSLYGKEKKYETGDRDRTLVLDLIRGYQGIQNSQKAKELSLELLESLNEEELLTAEMWEVICYYYVSTYGSKWWNFILKHDKEYMSLVGENVVRAKVGETMHPYLFGYIYGRKKAEKREEFKEYRKLVDKYQPKQKDVLYAFIELGESRSFDDFNAYFKTVLEVVPHLAFSEHYRYFTNDFDYLLTHANTKQKKQLEVLLKDSQKNQNEYVKPLYQKFFDKLSS